MSEYYYLKTGELIQEGDEVDGCRDGWRDDPKWVPATNMIGKKASDPRFPSHSRYRRKVIEGSDNDLSPTWINRAHMAVVNDLNKKIEERDEKIEALENGWPTCHTCSKFIKEEDYFTSHDDVPFHKNGECDAWVKDES